MMNRDQVMNLQYNSNDDRTIHKIKDLINYHY